VATSILTALAVVVTVYRVVLRCVARQFGWDDAYAVVASMGSIVCVVTSWVPLVKSETGQPSVISFWIYILIYPCIIWSVRLSILLSIARIMSPSQKSRRVMLSIAGLFVLMWIATIVMFVWRYTSDLAWRATLYDSGQIMDDLTLPMVIFELTTDVISDATLIILPIYSLRSMKLPRSQRRLIIVAFSSSIIVTIVSFFRAACQFFCLTSLLGTAIDIEVASSLFVCNSLVITTRVYRMAHQNGTASDASSSSSSNSDSNTRSSTITYSVAESPQFTTIDLNTLGNQTSCLSHGMPSATIQSSRL
ncbi:hypothetical protein BU15DRAFT_42375, partial [Melanogaster broomeanus]